MEKQCTKCKVVYGLDNFHKNKQAKDGLTSNCKGCRKITCKNHRDSTDYNKTYYVENKNTILKKQKDYYNKNKDKILSSCKKYRELHRETRILYFKQYYKDNRDALLEKSKLYVYKNRNRIAKYKKEWAFKNREQILINRHIKHYNLINRTRLKYVLAKIKATPVWADLAGIKRIYDKAKELTKLTGIKYEVDHIIPLQGKSVCGLHIPENLQLLDRASNASKGNKFHG